MYWPLILKIVLVLLWVFKWRWPLLVSKKYRAEHRQMPVLQRSSIFSNRLPIIVGWLTALGIIPGFFEIGTFRLPEWNILIRFTGLLFLVPGLIVQIFAINQLGQNYSSQVIIRKNQQLVTNGWYHFQRHPIYLGELLFYSGISLSLLSYLGLGLTLFLYFPILSYRSKIEERQLIRNFGDFYRNYRKFVRNFFPGF